MKTIFRYTNMALLAAVLLAFGAVAGSAQDNCADDEATAAARNAAGDKIREEYGKYGTVSLDEKGRIIGNAEGFLAKYKACPQAKDLVEYLEKYTPGMKTELEKAKVLAAKTALINRFDESLRNKNWDESFASGKEILAKYPDEYRTVEIVLASIAGEEAFKSNFKYLDDGLKFAKQSIADLEGNKSFVLGKETRYGLSLRKDPKNPKSEYVYNFEYSNKNKDDAMGWLNLYIGYMTAVGQKNTVAALPYLYKATQLTASDASKNSISYDLIGGYYFTELDKIIEDINKLRLKQDDPNLTEDELKRVVAEIKAKVAMSNGTSERAMDAFARAHNMAKDPAIKARLKLNVEKAYNVRHGKKEGVDAFIASTTTKPFVNPLTPITPISDEPTASTQTGTSVGVANGTGVGTANGTGVGRANGTGIGGATGTGIGTPGGAQPKPAMTTVKSTTPPAAKPAAKPAGAKPKVKRKAA